MFYGAGFWLLLFLFLLLGMLPQIFGGFIMSLIMLPYTLRAIARVFKHPPKIAPPPVTKRSLDDYIK